MVSFLPSGPQAGMSRIHCNRQERKGADSGGRGGSHQDEQMVAQQGRWQELAGFWIYSENEPRGFAGRFSVGSARGSQGVFRL